MKLPGKVALVSGAGGGSVGQSPSPSSRLPPRSPVAGLFPSLSCPDNTWWAHGTPTRTPGRRVNGRRMYIHKLSGRPAIGLDLARRSIAVSSFVSAR